MTCTDTHHPLVAGRLVTADEAFMRDYRSPPGSTWASRCFGLFCFRWNRHAEQVVVDDRRNGTLMVFNAPFRFRVEDRVTDAFAGLVERTVTINTPEISFPLGRRVCVRHVAVAQTFPDEGLSDGSDVVFLNGDATVPLDDGAHAYSLTEGIRREMYARLTGDTGPSYVSSWFAGLRDDGNRRIMAAMTIPPPYFAALDPANADDEAQGREPGEYAREMFQWVREVTDRIEQSPRVVVNREMARRARSTAIVPLELGYQRERLDDDAFTPLKPAPFRSPRPDGVDEWGLVLVELREHARRMGVSLARSGATTLRQTVEIAAGVEPGRGEEFALSADRAADGAVHVRCDRSLGILWSTDPFALLGSGGHGTDPDATWWPQDDVVQVDPDAQSPRPDPFTTAPTDMS